jgi:tetratricopeptide (TPR) repeat protein
VTGLQLRRKLLFPLAAVGLGLLLLAGLEVGLRLFGVAAFDPDPFVGFAGSHPFFIQVGRGGEARFQINPRHQQFFNEVGFPAKKPAGSYRVFVAGGSVAMGFPFYEPGSFARFLQVGLDALEPGRAHQVINVGAFGYASYRVARVVEEVLHYQPDLIVVMTGHNEFLEKRVYGEREKPGPWLTAVQSGLDRLRLYRALRQGVAFLRPAGEPLLKEEVSWEKSSRDPEQVARTLEHYRYNLEKISRLCREQGVPLVLMTLPSNLKDFPPLRSVHRPGLKPQELEEWNRDEQRGRELLAAGDAAGAVAAFAAAGETDIDYAELHFELGQAFLASGSAENASAMFWLAVRTDAWPVRAFAEMNQAVVEMLGPGVFVADALNRFADAAAYRIPGNDLFLDHCHPTLPGQALLAEAVLETLMQNRMVAGPENWRQSFQTAASDYQARLGQGWLGEAYYRAAFEVGVNLERPQEGLRLAEMALSLVPEHPKLRALMDHLRRQLRSSETAPPP